MATPDNELYPGLDDELDAAFQRHGASSRDGEETTALEEVVEQELGVTEPDPQGSTGSVLKEFEKQVERINEQILEATVVDSLQDLLIQKADIIREWIKRRSETNQTVIDSSSVATREKVQESSETARKEVKQTWDAATILDQATDLLNQGRQYVGNAQSYIQTGASSPQAAQAMREALDATILDQATDLLNQGRQYVGNAQSYIEAGATDATKGKMLETLDL
ncbi:MAG: hypothetical protein Q7R60_02720 [bacterium]|nr:hypothetical protein [bacterium]